MNQINKKRKIGIGIDFGTTNSLIVAKIDGDIAIIPNKHGDMLLQSVVHYTKSGQLKMFAEQQDIEFSTSSIKRLFADSINTLSPNFPHDLPKNIREKFRDIELVVHEGEICIKTKDGRIVSSIDIAQCVFETLKQNAEEYLQAEVCNVVLTVPAHFGENARLKISAAASRAGLKVVRLLNEPTAAAIAYGMDKNPNGYFAVYDMGGGTFDVSLMKIESGVLRILATGGDSLLGGDDFDQALVENIVITMNDREYKTEDHLMLARKAKEEQYSDEITDDLKILFDPLVKKSIGIFHKVCADAQISTKDLDCILLVGGGVKLKYIQHEIAKIAKEGAMRIADHPEATVAIGAAIQAYNIAYPEERYCILLDVVPMTLGLEMADGIVEPIIFRNTSVPCQSTRYFTTCVDSQNAFVLNIYQGESIYVHECMLIGQFEVGDLPEMPAGEARLAVTFLIDVSGLLTVSAIEESSGKEARIQVRKEDIWKHDKNN